MNFKTVESLYGFWKKLDDWWFNLKLGPTVSLDMMIRLVIIIAGFPAVIVFAIFPDLLLYAGLTPQQKQLLKELDGMKKGQHQPRYKGGADPVAFLAYINSDDKDFASLLKKSRECTTAGIPKWRTNHILFKKYHD
jgi:hypothetical protein